MNAVLMDAILYDNTLALTPSLMIDFNRINQTYARFEAAFPGAHIDYAMKANANPQVVRRVAELGGGLEIASPAELTLALDAGASGDRIICSNPIKTPMFLRRLEAAGVFAVVVDSVDEVEKVAQHMPGGRVYIRLSVDNTGSVLPLAGKFGVDGETALELCDQARELGLHVIGLSFHVGSQCLKVANWVNAIRACGDVWRAAAERGHQFYFLDIGGGFPAGHHHTPSIPTIEEIGDAVMAAVDTYIPPTDGLMLVLEPGRGLVGESGWLVTSVVGKAKRGADTWLYLDAGVFNGLMETYEGFPPVVRVLDANVEDRPMARYTLAGPSCDSCDVIARGMELPQINIGDRLLFLDAGAYTNEYAAAFNGFPIPQFVPLNVCETEAEDVFAPV
jgi:ornithine decarboxylase